MKDFKKGLNYSFLLLRYRARSSSEIISRLKKKGFEPSVRNKIVNYLKGHNYINDKDFAHSFLDYAKGKDWGPIRIDFNLKKLGISQKLRQKVLAKYINSGEKIKELIEQKIDIYSKKEPKILSEKIWQRIATQLVAKGFRYESISREIQKLGVNRFED